MHPGNLASKAFSKSSSDIQRPSWLGPDLGIGTVSLCSRVMMTVLLSILATSLGSVSANQLQKPQTTYSQAASLATSTLPPAMPRVGRTFWK